MNMRGNVKYSKSPFDTAEIARVFAETLWDGDTVLLSGDLGAGKTQFAKGIALGLGVVEEVTSPTFAIHNIYDGKFTLNHFDFYRLTPREAENSGFEEFLGAEGVAVVEWWQNAVNILPSSCYLVKISGARRRKIEIFNDFNPHITR